MRDAGASALMRLCVARSAPVDAPCIVDVELLADALSLLLHLQRADIRLSMTHHVRR